MVTSGRAGGAKAAAWDARGVGADAAVAAGTLGVCVGCAAAGGGGATGAADADCVRPDSSRRVGNAASSAMRIEVSLGMGAGAGGKNNRGAVRPQDSVISTSAGAA